MTHDASASTDCTGRLDAGQRGVDHFTAGLNCSESVLHAVAEVCDLDLPPAVRGMATAFGGGFGEAKCACGAITGGLMALGTVLGRSSADESAKPAAEAGRQLHDRFVAEFQTACCRELTSAYSWTDPARREACQAYVRFAAGTVASILDTTRG